jgi:predicted metal-dependent peptidase
MFNSLKLTAEQKLERAVTTIMRCKDLAFYASILFIGERKVVDAGNTYGCVTAMTNGKDEVYYRPFIDGLTDEELVFVILHECMHKLFRHTQLWGDLYSKDPLIANSSCDFVVNLMLMDMWNGSAHVRKVMQPLMKDGEHNFLYDEKYRGMDAKEVFMSLYDDVPPPPPPPPPPGEDEGEEGDDESNDEGNNPSDDEGDDEGDEEGNAPGRKPDDDADDGDGEGGDSGDSSDEDGDDAEDGDGDTDDGEPTDKPPTTTNDKRRELESKQFDQHKPVAPEERNAEEQQKLDIEIDRAIRNGMAIANKMGAHVPREIGELTEVKVDWCEVMREFVKQSHRGNDNATWRKFNRKLFVNDIYAPTYESERLGRIVVGIDTSGSINQQILMLC